MVAMFGRTRSGGGLDARIAELSGRGARPEVIEERRQAALLEEPVAPDPSQAETVPIEEQLARARDELGAHLDAEIRPDRRALLSQSDLENIVEAAAQAYCARHAIEAGDLARRDLAAEIMQRFATSDDAEAETPRNTHKAAVEAAKTQIQPLILEHMDVAA